jgi:hypothetical protein
MSKYQTPSTKTIATRLAGYIALKEVLNKLKDTPEGRNLLLRLIKAAYGLSAEDWGSLGGQIHNQTKFDKNYCKAACNWWKFVTHTEAQVVAIKQTSISDEVGILVPSDTSGYASLYVPCESCRTLHWVKNKSANFYLFELDKSAKENLLTKDYKLGEGVYNWETVKNEINQSIF